MSKVVITAEYDSETKTITVREPLEGVRTARELHLELVSEIDTVAARDEKPWMKLRGSLSKEAGDSFAAAINEMFPPWGK